MKCFGKRKTVINLEDQWAKERKKTAKFDESSYNSVIPISIVMEVGVLIFSVASYIFSTDRDVQPYSDTYLRLEEVFIAIMSGAMILNFYWLFHYRHSGHVYTKAVRISRTVEGCAVLAGAVILIVNAFKVNGECESGIKCHKIEAKFFAVGLAILDALLHLPSPVDTVREMPVVVVRGYDIPKMSVSKGGAEDGLQQQPQAYRPNANSMAVKVSRLAY